MSLADILSIAGATSVIIAAILSALWIWFSHKSRGPLGNLERSLREVMHTEVGRIEKRAVERHGVVCEKLDKLDVEINKIEDELDSVKTIALTAEGKADSALRILDRENLK